MVFSNLIFLFIFLPAVLFFYYVSPKNKIVWKNYILLIFSLFFYFYGEPRLIVVLLISLFLNYLFGLTMDKPYKKLTLILAIILNVGNLIYFKYTNFFITNINSLFNSNIQLINIIMPIGISFYTFQAMSYVIDSYRNPKLIQKNPLFVFLYVIMFPQLIAGPIVRYEDVALQIVNRNHSFEKFSSGINRFIQGLSKKVLLANSFALIADNIFGTGTAIINSSLAWLGAIAYTFQIYYDFSGYSDMAIGLGRMFGFEFLENFNYPYISKSITEFWRRWHISLSTWFRDYVYIPLGGNRKGFYRQILNILVVWFLTGFWHGAEWNFMIWGMYFAFILIIEKLFLLKYLEKFKLLNHIYSLFLIIIGWVIFRSESLGQIIKYLQAMFSFSGGIHKDVLYYLAQYKFEFIFGFIFQIPFIMKIKRNKFTETLLIVVEIILFALVIMSLLQSTYNPFIYFRF